MKGQLIASALMAATLALTLDGCSKKPSEDYTAANQHSSTSQPLAPPDQQKNASAKPATNGPGAGEGGRGPTVSKAQEEAYNRTYQSDIAQEQQLRAGGTSPSSSATGAGSGERGSNGAAPRSPSDNSGTGQPPQSGQPGLPTPPGTGN